MASKEGQVQLPRLLTPEEIFTIVGPLVSPNGPFTIGLNERGRYFPKAPRNMIDFFLHHFEEWKDREFIVYQNERYTYGQTYDICSTLALQLINQFNVKAGDRVAIAMRNYPEWCFAFIAIILVGGIAVPLNSWWREKELKYGITDSSSKVIFCDEPRLHFILPFISTIPLSVILVRKSKEISLPNNVFLYENLLQTRANLNESAKIFSQISQQVEKEKEVLIMYTSGTTGDPKGVVLTHIGVVSQMEVLKLLNIVQEKAAEILMNEAKQLGKPFPAPPPQPDQHVVLCAVPLFHVTASHHIFLQSFVQGKKMILIYKWDSSSALKIIEQEKVSQFTGVPTMGADLMDNDHFSSFNTNSLLSLGAGGAATPITQVRKIPKFFKFASPSIAYGLTETNGAICMNAGYGALLQPDSVGAPFPIVEVKVVDLDNPSNLDPLPPNTPGELLIKSNLVMKEYWNKPKATKEVLSEGWFRTGDIAVLDERNRIYIVDRAKDIIIRGGENISCNEVERAIFQHASVRECSVFGLPDERLGEVVAVLILLKGKATAEEIVQHLKGLLADFKIPNVKNVYFTDSPLPRGPTGKILKRAIRDKILAQNPPQLQSKL